MSETELIPCPDCLKWERIFNHYQAEVSFAALGLLKECFATESYEGLLLVALMASKKKITAGLEYAASGQYQDYQPGTLELGVALDAVNLMVSDILNFIKANASHEFVKEVVPNGDASKCERSQDSIA